MRCKHCAWHSLFFTAPVLTRDGASPLLGLPLAAKALLNLIGPVWAQQLSQRPRVLIAILASLAAICSHALLSMYLPTHQYNSAIFRAGA